MKFLKTISWVRESKLLVTSSANELSSKLERISKRNIELESHYTEFLNIADILPSSVVVISMEVK